MQAQLWFACFFYLSLVLLPSRLFLFFFEQHFDDGERVSLLFAVLRLLWSKTGYDEVTRAECQPAIDGVFKCLASEDHTVGYPAALVVRSAFVGGVLVGAGVGVLETASGQKTRRAFTGCRY